MRERGRASSIEEQAETMRGKEGKGRAGGDNEREGREGKRRYASTH